MRRSTMRRHSGAIGRLPKREAESDRLARLTREIVEETGAHAPLLLGLIERRAANIGASESAAFILDQWRNGGDDRTRLLAHAVKDGPTIRIEQDLAIEIRRVLAPLAGLPFSVERFGDVRRALVNFLRSRLPKAKAADLVQAAEEAIDYRGDRLAVRMDSLVRVIAAPTLSS